MRLGIQTKVHRFSTEKYFFTIYIPLIKVGLFIDEDNDNSRWFGLNLNLKNEISYEIYGYGKIFTLIICGLGFDITKIML